MLKKYFVGEIESTFKCKHIKIFRQFILSSKKRNQFFHWNISYQFVVCHRTSSSAFNCPVKSPATCQIGCIYFGISLIWMGVKMSAKFKFWVGQNQFFKNKIDILSLCCSHCVRKGDYFDPESS